jgi:hypothetical protein
VLGDEAVDRGLEIDEGAEHAVLKPPAGEDREEPFDRIQPGTRRREEVEGPAPMTIEPGPHLAAPTHDVSAFTCGKPALDTWNERERCRTDRRASPPSSSSMMSIASSAIHRKCRISATAHVL